MKNNKVIGLFVAVSITAHGLLLYNFKPQDAVTPVVNMMAQQLAVSVSAVSSKADAPDHKELSTHKSQRHTNTNPAVIAVKKPAEQTVSQVPNKTQTQENNRASNITSNKPQPEQKIVSDLRNKYRSHVKAHVKRQFADYFYYPKIATRKGWQGNVLLGFNVSNEGKITNIRITKSSGYNILDNAAVTSLLRVKSITPLVIQTDKLLKYQEVNIKLPVIFKLTGT